MRLPLGMNRTRLPEARLARISLRNGTMVLVREICRPAARTVRSIARVDSPRVTPDKIIGYAARAVAGSVARNGMAI